jgi:hypothetical protein
MKRIIEIRSNEAVVRIHPSAQHTFLHVSVHPLSFLRVSLPPVRPVRFSSNRSEKKLAPVLSLMLLISCYMQNWAGGRDAGWNQSAPGGSDVGSGLGTPS